MCVHHDAGLHLHNITTSCADWHLHNMTYLRQHVLTMQVCRPNADVAALLCPRQSQVAE